MCAPPSSLHSRSESLSLPKINENLWGQKKIFSVRWSERALALQFILAP